MHRRAVVRQAIESALSGVTAAVTVGMFNPERLAGLPAVNIVTGAETVEEEAAVFAAPDSGKWPQERVLVVDIECRVTGTALDDDLDALALEVEQALGADMGLGGEVDKLEYTGSDASELTGELEAPVGLRTLTYEAIYRVDARDPQALEA